MRDWEVAEDLSALFCVLSLRLSSIWQGSLVIFLGCHSVFLPEGPEKVIVSAEAAQLVYLRDGKPLRNVFLAEFQLVFNDVTVERLAGSFFKFS